jgi:nitrogen fixation NifU-like protein
MTSTITPNNVILSLSKDGKENFGRMNIYRENILEHFRHPRNHGQLAKPDYSFYDINTLCGDELTIDLKFSPSPQSSPPARGRGKGEGASTTPSPLRGEGWGEGVLTDIKFRGRGCAISQAAASMLSEKIKGLNKKQILALNYKNILKLLEVELSPARLKCATLALNIIKTGLNKL